MMVNYDNFQKSLKLLEEQNNNLKIISGDGYPDWVVDGIKESVIQRFETCWDCSWKVLKVYLMEEIGLPNVPNSPKKVIRLADGNDLLPSSVDQWLLYVKVRIGTAHDYSGKKAQAALGIVNNFVKDAIELYQTLSGEGWR